MTLEQAVVNPYSAVRHLGTEVKAQIAVLNAQRQPIIAAASEAATLCDSASALMQQVGLGAHTKNAAPPDLDGHFAETELWSWKAWAISYSQVESRSWTTRTALVQAITELGEDWARRQEFDTASAAAEWLASWQEPEKAVDVRRAMALSRARHAIVDGNWQEARDQLLLWRHDAETEELQTRYSPLAWALGPVTLLVDIPIEGKIDAICFSPDETYLVAAGKDSAGYYCLQLWSVSDGLPRAWRPLGSSFLDTGQQYNFTVLKFSPDGRQLAIGSNRGVLIRDLASGEEVVDLVLSRDYPCYDRDAWHVVDDIHFAADGSIRAALRKRHETAEIWDVQSRKRVANISVEHGVNRLAFSPDGTLLAAGGGSGYAPNQVSLWGAASGCQVGSFFLDSYLYDLTFSEDGRFLLSVLYKEVIVYDIKSMQVLGDLKNERSSGFNSVQTTKAPVLATAFDHVRISVFDVPTRTLLATIQTETEYETDSLMALSSDGRFIAFAGKNRLKIYSPQIAGVAPKAGELSSVSVPLRPGQA